MLNTQNLSQRSYCLRNYVGIWYRGRDWLGLVLSWWCWTMTPIIGGFLRDGYVSSFTAAWCYCTSWSCWWPGCTHASRFSLVQTALYACMKQRMVVFSAQSTRIPGRACSQIVAFGETINAVAMFVYNLASGLDIHIKKPFAEPNGMEAFTKAALVYIWIAYLLAWTFIRTSWSVKRDLNSSKEKKKKKFY